jgi:hypothetical protein
MPPAIGLLLLTMAVAGAVTVAYYLSAVCMTTRIIGPPSGASAATYVCGFVILIVLPAFLGALGRWWGSALGFSYAMGYSFFALPWLQYNEMGALQWSDIAKPHDYLAFTAKPYQVILVVLIVGTLVSLAAGLLATRWKPVLDIRSAYWSVLPILAAALAVSLLSAPIMELILEGKPEVLSFPEYNFQVTCPRGWSSVASRGIEYKVEPEFPFHYDFLLELFPETGGYHGGEAWIRVYSRMPITNDPIPESSTSDKVLSDLQDIFTYRMSINRQIWDNSHVSNENYDNRDGFYFVLLGDTTISGIEGIQVYYDSFNLRNSLSFEKNRPQLQENAYQYSVFVYKQPNLYELQFDFRGPSPGVGITPISAEESKSVVDEILDSFEFI